MHLPQLPIHFLQGLKISRRFLLSISLFSLPLGILFYFNVDQLSSNVAFASSEREGNRLQQDLIHLLYAAGSYRISPADLAAKNTLSEMLDECDKPKSMMADLRFTPAQLHADGQDALAIPSMTAALRNLIALPLANTEAREKQYSAVIGNLRTAISHAGDTSNLTLDPEMDSYYMADMTSVATAQTIGRINDLMAFLEPLLINGKPLSASEITQAAVFAAELNDSDFQRITGDIDTAMAENLKAKRGVSSSLKPRLSAPYDRYKSATQSLLKLLDNVGKGQVVSASEFHSVASSANAAALELWQPALAELDVLLEMRIGMYANYRLKLIVGTVIALALALIVSLLIIQSIIQPLTTVMHQLKQVSTGDLISELDQSFYTRPDEIGDLSRAVRGLSSSFRDMIYRIKSRVNLLENSADPAGSSATVSVEVQALSAGMKAVAGGMEQAAVNLQNVTSATAQMTSSMDEISQHTEMARMVTEEATGKAAKITERIAQLGEAASEIDTVTQAIMDVSWQINLLSVNASIEAARAGEAGAGFAVVALEIKDLAAKTAAATADVKKRVERVQSATAKGINEIRQVSTVIQDISEIVQSISSSVNEHSLAAKEISRNVAEASSEVNLANQKVLANSQESGRIVADLSKVAVGIESSVSQFKV